MRTALSALALILALALALAAPTARADDSPVPEADVGPSANDWLRVGLERYERGNLVGAIDAFERGNAREPRPVFLFALAQAHRKRGDCARARALFDTFLASNPPEAQAAAAREQRERCEEAAPPPPPPPPEPVAVAAVPAPPPPPPPSTRPWYRDRLAVGAGAAGVILLGSSGALWLSAQSAADAAATTDSYDRHQLLRERAESRQLYAGIALGAGVAAAGVTVWRLTRDRTEPRPPVARTTVAPVLTPDTVGVSLGGSF